MSERWRKKLRDLDNAGPSDDVFERAKQGPTHGDDVLPGPRTSTRIVTVVVAFLVFALAISAFVIPALRFGTQPGADSGGIGTFPLWPVQTHEALDRLQADPPVWSLDPQAAAVEFVHDVMGWSEIQASMVDPGCVEPGVSSGVPSASQGPMSCPGIVASGAPTILPNVALADDAPTFRLLTPSCPDCLGKPNWSIEYVQVYQPLEQGDGGIWAVLQAASPSIQLSVQPWQTIHDGATISAGFLSDLSPVLAYQACIASDGTTSFHSPGGPAMGAALLVSLPDSPVCSGETPGYAFGTLGERNLGPINPFEARVLGLVGLTAVPIVALFPENDAASSSSQPTSSTSSASPVGEPASYTDPMGWSIEVPAGWEATPHVGEANQGATIAGVVDGVRIDVSIWHYADGIVFPPGEGPSPQDDTALPLDPGAFEPGEGGPRMWFMTGGIPFRINVGSRSTLEPGAEAVVDEMIRSITFQPWAVGDLRNGWTAIGEVHPAATAEWITYEGDSYLTYIGGEGDGGRVVYGPAPRCLPGEPQPLLEVRETGVAAITCQDGQTGEWRFDSGEAGSTNDERFADPLPKHRAVLSWDGFLLVDLMSTIQ